MDAPLARGRDLDMLCLHYGMPRRRLWWTLWLAREGDASLRRRTARLVYRRFL